MWVDNKPLFFLSGIASFGLFFILLVVILWQASLIVPPIMYATSKSNFIAISLEASSLSDKAKVSIQPKKLQEKPKEKPQEKVVVQERVTPKEAKLQPTKEITPLKSLPKSTNVKVKTAQPEINDLFSSVKTVHPSKPTQKKSSELAALNALEKEVLSSKRSSQLFEKAKSFQLAKSNVKFINKGSGGPMVNEYYAKVQKVIYAHFHPVSGTQGFKADVLMVLTSEGKLTSFRVVNSSGNSLFDAELELLNERLKHVVLPKNPTGESATFEIILSAKE
jgi:outer membrane biosynthesis protein TonB